MQFRLLLIDLAMLYRTAKRKLNSLQSNIWRSFRVFFPEKPWLIKRPSFRHEQEVRATIRDADCKKPGLKIFVDTEALIEKIHVSPESEPWIEDVVKDLVARYGFSKSVQRSSLYTLR